LGAHTRELGISETSTARPIQAALASATARSAGVALLIVMFAPVTDLIIFVTAASLIFLTLLGVFSGL
jgi:VIT1/CCC1 family predicted Fe2+/Mn2+ transporter